MPTLINERGDIACTILEKAEFLRTRFYPTMEVDLSDIEDPSFTRESLPPNSIEVKKEVGKEEAELALKSRKPFKALGLDGIPNGFLQAMGPKMVEAIAKLAMAC